MAENKMLYLRRLSFVIILSIFGVVNLVAQSDDMGEFVPTSEFKTTVDKFEASISGIEENIEKLKETTGDYKSLLEKTLKLPIWQIISAISEALIALFILGAVVLLVLKKAPFHASPDDAPKEHPIVVEPKDVAHEVLVAEFNTLKDKIDDIQSQLRRLTDKIDSQSREASCFESNLTSFQTEMADNKQKIRNMEDTVSSIKTGIDKDIEKRTRREEVESDPVAVFNKWAQTPRLSLPLYFTYVVILKLEFRMKQEFTKTTVEADWIINTIGEQKYIFPNPNKIDSLSGPVDKLYKVIGTRKSPGANLVKITNACQIKEGNFIEYQGELQLM
jgi:prefoldin subunit 5